MPNCPPSEFAVASIKALSEAYRNLISAAREQEGSEIADKAQKLAAWRRAEHTGQMLDDLVANWEQGACPAVFYSCAWEQCQRNLEVINTLTPCNQWQMPLPVNNQSKSSSD